MFIYSVYCLASYKYRGGEWSYKFGKFFVSTVSLLHVAVMYVSAIILTQSCRRYGVFIFCKAKKVLKPWFVNVHFYKMTSEPLIVCNLALTLLKKLWNLSCQLKKKCLGLTKKNTSRTSQSLHSHSPRQST